MMLKLALTCIAVVTSTAVQAQQPNQVQGDVSAQWHDPQLISVADSAKFFPGQTLTIRLSGTVDINPNEHNECNKDWLGQCHRSYWTEHHFNTPASAPGYFVLQRIGDSAQKLQFQVGAEVQTVPIPDDAQNFDKPYELRGYLAAPKTGIDPARSTNSYHVDIGVDSLERINELPSFFSARNPVATDIVDNRNVIDRYSASQSPEQCAQKIRTYATEHFPITGGQGAKENQLELLEFAKRLAPLDVENSRSLAVYYGSIGASAQAEKAYEDTIKLLEQKVAVGGAPKDKAQLAESYSSLASTIASNSGSVSPSALEKADGLYERAASIFEDIKFFDQEGTTLTARANGLRRLKTRDTLKAAIRLYKEAQGKTATSVVGDLVFRSIDGQTIFSGPIYAGYRAIDIQSGKSVRDFFQFGRDFVPVAWDATSRRLLLQSRDQMVWHDPFDQSSQTVSTTAIIASSYEAAAGVILARPFDGSPRVLTKSGSDFPIQVGTESQCEYTQVPLFAGMPQAKASGYGPTTISLDGSTVAVVCDQVIGITQVLNDSVKSVAIIDLAKLSTTPRLILGIALSPNGQSLAAVTRSLPSGPLPQVGAPTVYDDRLLLWNNVRTDTKSAREFPLAEQVKSPRPGGFITSAIAVSFTPDGAAVAVCNGGSMQVVVAATGASTTSLLVNANQFVSPRAVLPGGGLVTFEITASDELVIKDSATNSIALISWPSREITNLQLSPEASGATRFGTLVTRITPSGHQILWVTERNYVLLTHQISPLTAKAVPLEAPTIFDVGLGPQGVILLAGGHYLISGNNVGQQVDVIKIGGDRRLLGSSSLAGHSFILGLSHSDSWVRIVTGGDQQVLTIDIMSGFEKVGEIPLPPVPNSYKDRLLKSMQSYLDQWTKNGKPEVSSTDPSSLSNPTDVQQAVSHPERLDLVGWRPNFDTPGSVFLPFAPDCCSPATFEPIARFKADDDRILQVPLLGPILAIVDFTQKSPLTSVSINDFESTPPLAIFDSTSALVLQTSSSGPQWFIRSLTTGKLQSLPNPQLLARTADSLPAFIAYETATNDPIFNIFGATEKMGGYNNYWLETFSIDSSGIHDLTCSQCSVDLTKLGELNQATMFYSPFPWFNSYALGIKFSSNLGRLIRLDGDFLEAFDLNSHQVLLSTNAALPRLIEQNVAIVQDTQHLLKLYGLGGVQ